MSSKDFNPETIEMDMKEELNSQEDDSLEKFTREAESTSGVDEIEIKHEEMDYHLYPNSTTDDQSDFDLETMYSIANAECESTEVEEKDLKDFYHDILLCERDCETCVKYMRMLSEHVRATHAPPQPIQDPLLIDPVPVPLTGQSSSPILIKSTEDENIVKMELDCSDSENTSEDEFIRESETTTIVDKIEIKHEDMDFHLHHNSTAEVQSEGHSHSSIQQLSRIAHFECGSTKAEEKYLNDFYLDLLMRERDCETCVKYMKMLTEHVRATHAPPQPTQDPLLIDPTSSIQIKSEADENIVNMDCFDAEEVSTPNSDADADPDYNLESESDSDPDYAPSSSFTRKPRRQGQGSVVKNHTGSKSKKKNLVSRDHSNVKKRVGQHITVPAREKRHKCDVCMNSFAKPSHLTVHMRVHTGEKPFKCDMCEKGFPRPSALTEHKRFHTGERPFKCNVCEKGFPRAFALTVHKRLHTGVKPFKCDECIKSFSQLINLQTHKMIHTGERRYTCDVCKKCFSTSRTLTAHKVLHTGEKPFKCSVCDKSFNIKGTLTTHMRIHTREKPFQCDQCGKSFTQKSNLIAHKRNHTG